MEKLIDSISELAAKVLDAFGKKQLKKSEWCSWHRKVWEQLYSNYFPEPLVKNGTKETVHGAPDNTYFVSFLLRGGKNKNLTATDITPKKRMVVNNNFSGEKMRTNQYFHETGPSAKQPPSHNVQLLNNPNLQAPNPPPQSFQPQANQPYPNKIQQKPQQQPKPRRPLI